MTTDPDTLAELSPAGRIEALRRRMASIPARTDGSAAPAVPSERAEARFETRPETITESATSVLEVPSAIATLLPRRGLARGSVVAVDGASSVLLSLLASVTGSGKHAAIIGLPKLGLLAATEMGAELGRCALIPSPGSAAIDVAAILLDGMDLVVLGLAGAAVPPTRARAVVARARSKGACLVVTEGRWDGADIRIDSHVAGYTGIGQGYGRITGISVDVEVSGQGSAPTVRQIRSERHRWRRGMEPSHARTVRTATSSTRTMTAPDFTGWREPWPLTPTLHQLAEPKSVVVEMNRALPLAKNAQRPDRLPLRVLAGGLRLEGTMPGYLYAWARLSDGQWLCCVKIHATTGDGKTGLDLWLWVTADAVSAAQ